MCRVPRMLFAPGGHYERQLTAHPNGKVLYNFAVLGLPTNNGGLTQYGACQHSLLVVSGMVIMQFIVGITGVTAGKLLVSKLERVSFKKKVMRYVSERGLMPALTLGPLVPLWSYVNCTK